MTYILPKLPRIAYGADYNPEQWPRDVWREDVRLMQEAGVNLVSVGIFSWAALQPAPDRFTPEWLDEVMDLLHAHGIAVNLATATASPPAWLIKARPEILPVTAAGTRLGHGARQHYAPWSLAYREHAAVLVRFLAKRYGRHPALVSWHINNEYCCHTKESFDAFTAARWRTWLRERHGDIESVNKVWNTAFWSQRYADFDEISVPALSPTILNPGMMLDWRRFCSDAFVDLVRMEANILRAETPNIPVNTNFVGWHDLPWINHRAIAAELDYVSWDSYPDPGEGLDAVQANALCHDFMRSLKPGRPFVLMEQAPSAVNWRTVNVPRAPGVTRAYTHQSIARGADGALYFQWRQSAAGAEQFHSAMVPVTGLRVGGHENRVWQTTRELGRELARLEPVAGSTSPAHVALLVDYESIWATEHDSKPTRMDVRREIARLHRPLWRRNVPVDIRHPEDDLTGYSVLIAPALALLSPRAATNLRNFVSRGGHLLFTPFSAVFDHTTRIAGDGVPGGLTDLFGYAVEEWWPAAPGCAGRVDGEIGEFTWANFAELGYATTAEVLASFADDWFAGRPALTRRSHKGGGSAWYLAAHLEPAGMDAVVAKLLSHAGVSGLADTPEGVEVTRRISESGLQFLHIINHTGTAANVALPGLKGRDLITEADVSETLRLPARDVAVVALG